MQETLAVERKKRGIIWEGRVGSDQEGPHKGSDSSFNRILKNEHVSGQLNCGRGKHEQRQ